jgi:hypothetical protein
VVGAHAQYNEVNLALEPAIVAAKYKYENLQLFPIRANSTFKKHHESVGNYVTLKEALAKNKIAITEAGQGSSSGTVNTLFIENISSDTIMILGGEVVQGGKQDRMIAQDFILYPGSGKKDVSVFCVEQGRWQTKADGKSFKECYSISSNEVRKAGTVKKNQREVWNKVADVTNKNTAGSSTGTYAALKESESYNKDLKKYLAHFNDLLSRESDVIGMVAVSGDKILGSDMFATHDLFKSHYANLLNSYATEAMSTGKPVTIQYDKVKEYLQLILKDETTQETEVQKNGTLLKEGEKKLHLSTF